MRPGKRDKKTSLLIQGAELEELQKYTYLMSECFGLDDRIGAYQGKRPIGLYSWDFECLIEAIECALRDPRNYPGDQAPGYRLLHDLSIRIQAVYREAYP